MAKARYAVDIYNYGTPALLDIEALYCFISCIFMVLIQKHKQDTS